jgi:hypothetical protein
MIDRKVVICHSTQEQKCWIDAFKHQSKQASLPATPKPQTLQVCINTGDLAGRCVEFLDCVSVYCGDICQMLLNPKGSMFKL